jgi:hypothetical protein
LPDAFAGVALDAHLRHDTRLLRDFGQPARFKHFMRQRFLAEHVLPRLHAGRGYRRMRVVRRGDENGIDVTLRSEHLAIVFVAFRFWKSIERLGRVYVIDVAQGHDVLAREAAQVRAAHSADSDSGDVQLFVRRLRPRRIQCSGRRDPGKRYTRQKVTTIDSASPDFSHAQRRQLLNVI